MGENFHTANKITRVIDATAAGITDVQGTSIDMADFDEVTYVVCFGTIVAGAVTGVQLQTSDDDATWNDVAGSAVTVADTDDTSCAYITLTRPLERYSRVEVTRTVQNSTIDSAIAIQSNPAVQSTTHDSSTVLGGVHVVSPAEGTP